MLTEDNERRAIELTDAAGRAHNNSLPELALKLSKQAEKLLGGGQTFEEWAQEAGGFNLETYQGQYVSKTTQVFQDCWNASK